MSAPIPRHLRSPVALLVIAITTGESRAELPAHWRFEEVIEQGRSRSTSVVGESLTGRDNQAVNPRPYSRAAIAAGAGVLSICFSTWTERSILLRRQLKA